MATFTKITLIDTLLRNNEQQPKAKYANNILLHMADKMENGDTVQAEITRSKKGVAYNRGSIGECLVRIAILRYCVGYKSVDTTKHDAKIADLDTTMLNSDKLAELGLPVSKNIEIKFANSFANATPKTNKAHWVLLANQHGVYLIPANKVKTTKTGHITPNQFEGKHLKKLSELLGY